jgi:hypothetical protein
MYGFQPNLLDHLCAHDAGFRVSNFFSSTVLCPFIAASPLVLKKVKAQFSCSSPSRVGLNQKYDTPLHF